MNKGGAKIIRDQAARRLAIFEQARVWRQQGKDLQDKGEQIRALYGPIVPKHYPVSMEGTASIPDESKLSGRER